MTFSITCNVTACVVAPGAGATAGSNGFQSAFVVALKSIVASFGSNALLAVAAPAAGVVPATLMSSSIPAALWPATVHHACVDASNGPIVIVSVSPGFSIFVPSVPLRRRSCSTPPLLCTCRVTFSPLGTVIDLGLMEMSASSILASVTVLSATSPVADASDVDGRVAATRPMPNAISAAHSATTATKNVGVVSRCTPVSFTATSKPVGYVQPYF